MHRSPRFFIAFTILLALCGVFVIGGGLIEESQVALLAEGTGNATDGTTAQFQDVAQDVSLDYTAVESYDASTDVVTDAGAYANDYNTDGWTDVLLTGGKRPVLYENVGGDFERSDALPELDRNVQAALFFDYDNDGREDLLILSLHRKPLFFENQEGSFERVNVGLNQTLSLPTGASVGDYNRDGCLDLFISQMGNWSQGPPSGFRYTVESGGDDGGQNLLYRGTCSRFVNATAGTDIRGRHWSLATSFVDVTRDGYPDVHVANDFGQDVLYVNRGDGTFDRQTIGSVVNRSEIRVLGPRTNRNAMASEVADVNGDGYLDLFVTNIYSVVGQYTHGPQTIETRGNNLFLGGPNATFRERSEELGVEDGGWGWAAAITDLDNDGDRDIVHTTMTLDLTPQGGLTASEIREIYRHHPSYRFPVLFEQTGSGFNSTSPNETGFDRTDGRGLVRFDFDRDGDQDILIANAGGPFRLYENRGAEGKSIQVRLQHGASGEARSVGARISVTVNNHTSVQVRNARSDFLSQDSRTLHFGVADHTRVDIKVVWPDGSERRFTNVPTGQRIVITPEGIVKTEAFNGLDSD